MNPFPDAASLGEARRWLREQAAAKGADCPCCRQFTKIYKRSINAGMAHALVVMYRENGCEWQDKTVTLRGFGAAARDESLLRFWGLTAEDTRRREDGGHAGWWRVTERGAAFVERRLTVPKYALIYNGDLLRLDEASPQVEILGCIRDRFDLGELMSRRAVGFDIQR